MVLEEQDIYFNLEETIFLVYLNLLTDVSGQEPDVTLEQTDFALTIFLVAKLETV